MTEKVAIIIPTMNRADFLIRQLEYYKSVKSPHPIYIGDSSNKKEKSCVKQDKRLKKVHFAREKKKVTVTRAINFFIKL